MRLIEQRLTSQQTHYRSNEMRGLTHRSLFLQQISFINVQPVYIHTIGEQMYTPLSLYNRFYFAIPPDSACIRLILYAALLPRP